jgi:hypothetical protein
MRNRLRVPLVTGAIFFLLVCNKALYTTPAPWIALAALGTASVLATRNLIDATKKRKR